MKEIIKSNVSVKLDDQDELACPQCEEPYTLHISQPITHWDDEDYSAPIGTRGEWIEISTWCESGHSMTLIIGAHKGSTFMRWVLHADITDEDYQAGRI